MSKTAQSSNIVLNVDSWTTLLTHCERLMNWWCFQDHEVKGKGYPKIHTATIITTWADETHFQKPWGVQILETTPSHDKSLQTLKAWSPLLNTLTWRMSQMLFRMHLGPFSVYTVYQMWIAGCVMQTLSMHAVSRWGCQGGGSRIQPSWIFTDCACTQPTITFSV